jgi:hypothetical protein
LLVTQTLHDPVLSSAPRRRIESRERYFSRK